MQLAENLNAMRGPTRTVAKWKTLTGCKNQLRSRARRVVEHTKATGGGPPTEDVSEFEQQALKTFGVAAVYGRLNMGTLGHEEPTCNSQPVEIDIIETEVVIPNDLVLSPMAAGAQDSTLLQTQQTPVSETLGLNDTPTASTGIKDHNPRVKTTQAVASLNAALHSLKVKDERDASQHELLVAALQQLNSSVIELTEVIKKLNANLDLS
ncbi:PREDICTED: uncharacterized protein LOC108364892 [Rhagoletis zephyria]|uniref:uncharacterized protein LOC108364892 n=1 Tax=Rhagoletis zephyria TaxID=28612 RepID=UPI00081141F7|nr:PREDICTED: uncharacterized protein LOC108364892 [Rhagoletis zephyria]XP_017474250.1 PREDICTED: uncharacterized protein LOC108364892 [Rhagoletis zephyria]